MASTVDTLEHDTGEKGLKTGALGFISSVVIGVASTAPGYSLAASLGLVTIVVGLQAPAIMLLAFVPMLFIASAYYYLNRADPDCGTTFSWVTRAMGPHLGWMGGWGIIAADIIVMANLAQIAGQYTFYLFGADSLANSKWWSLALGVLWIVVMTWICYVGIEASAKTQWFLLGAEVVILGIFAVVALYKVYTPSPVGSIHPSLSWINPFEIKSTSALADGIIVAVFIYWGWDSTVTVNEETENSTETPGQGRPVGDGHPRPALRDRLGGRAGLPRRRLPLEQLRRRLQSARRRRARLAVGQAADHRRAHLGVGFDADDDPADRAHVALDGGPRRHPEAVREHPPPLSDAVDLDDLHGHRSRSSGTSASRSSASRSCSRRSPASA